MIVTTLRRAVEQLDKLSGERAGLEEALKVGPRGGHLFRACCLLHLLLGTANPAEALPGVLF